MFNRCNLTFTIVLFSDAQPFTDRQQSPRLSIKQLYSKTWIHRGKVCQKYMLCLCLWFVSGCLSEGPLIPLLIPCHYMRDLSPRPSLYKPLQILHNGSGLPSPLARLWYHEDPAKKKREKVGKQLSSKDNGEFQRPLVVWVPDLIGADQKWKWCFGAHMCLLCCNTGHFEGIMTKSSWMQPTVQEHEGEMLFS